MSRNVLEQLQNEKGRLAEVLVQNEDMCAAVMGLLAILCNTCINQIGKPVAGIHIGDVMVDGNTFKARVTFRDVASAPKVGWTPKRDFAEFVAEKAGALALALAINPSLDHFFGDLMERFIMHAQFKGLRFADIVLTKHIITPDWLIIMEVGKRPLV